MRETDRRAFTLYARLNVHRRKVEIARARVSRWLAIAQHPYVAFSAGKDSTCVLAIVREQRPDMPAVYFDAESAFPEVGETLSRTRNLIKFKCDEPLLATIARLGIFHPRLEAETMKSTVYGPVKRLVAQYGFDAMAYGLRADECRGRRLHAYTRGSVFRYRRDGVVGCQPIWDWSYMDVWAFIVSMEITYCGVYDRLWDAPREDQRLSYWAGETKRSYGRYAWLKRNYPDLWNRLVTAVPEVSAFA